MLGAAQQVSLQRLLKCARQPLEVNGIAQEVLLTCGYVFLPEVPQASVDLVKDATIVLKRAKRAKRDHRGQHLRYSDHMGPKPAPVRCSCPI